MKIATKARRHEEKEKFSALAAKNAKEHEEKNKIDRFTQNSHEDTKARSKEKVKVARQEEKKRSLAQKTFTRTVPKGRALQRGKNPFLFR